MNHHCIDGDELKAYELTQVVHAWKRTEIGGSKADIEILSTADVHPEICQIGSPRDAADPTPTPGDVSGGISSARAILQAHGLAAVEAEAHVHCGARRVREFRAGDDGEPIGAIPAVQICVPQAAIPPIPETPIRGIPRMEPGEAVAYGRLVGVADAVRAARRHVVALVLGGEPEGVPLLVLLDPHKPLRDARLVDDQPRDVRRIVYVEGVEDLVAVGHEVEG